MTYGQCFELLCCLLFPLLLKRQKKRVKEKLDQSLLQVMIEFDHRFAVIQGKKHNGKGFFFFSVNRHDIQPKKKRGTTSWPQSPKYWQPAYNSTDHNGKVEQEK